MPTKRIEIADGIASRQECVSVLHRPGKLGMGSAYRDGFRHALARGADLVFEMDADLSHNPKFLPALLDGLSRDSDVVIGSRRVAGGGTRDWGLARKLLSAGGSLYARATLGVGLHDLTSGFTAWRRDVLASIDLSRIRSEGFGFQIEMNFKVWRKGLRVKEIPIVFADRRVGVSKMNRRIVWEAMWLVWKLRLQDFFGRL